MLDLTSLADEVTEQETVTEGATTLMNTLFAEVEANKTDPAALQALVDRGRGATAKLAKAILDNTETPAVPGV